MDEISNVKRFRDGVIELEETIKSFDGAFVGDSDVCPLKHHFTDGIYTREIFIPAGTYIVGKIHKHAHPNFLMKGSVEVITESGGKELLSAPMFMISPAGTKRALFTLEDTTWITIHHNPNNEKDISVIEGFVIADSYEDYEKFVNKSNFYKGLINGINNLFKKISK